jgi:hypothetical protein
VTETGSQRRIGRSVGAIFAGLVVVIVLSLGTDVALYKLGIFPQPGKPTVDGPLALATVYRSIYGVLGSYIAAWLAPSRRLQHALLLGVIGFVLSVAGAAMAWNHQSTFGPGWYPIALVVLSLPQAWLGGKLRLMHLANAADI